MLSFYLSSLLRLPRAPPARLPVCLTCPPAPSCPARQPGAPACLVCPPGCSGQLPHLRHMLARPPSPSACPPCRLPGLPARCPRPPARPVACPTCLPVLPHPRRPNCPTVHPATRSPTCLPCIHRLSVSWVCLSLWPLFFPPPPAARPPAHSSACPLRLPALSRVSLNSGLFLSVSPPARCPPTRSPVCLPAPFPCTVCMPVLPNPARPPAAHMHAPFVCPPVLAVLPHPCRMLRHHNQKSRTVTQNFVHAGWQAELC